MRDSLAPHHRECPVPFDKCDCQFLFKRDRDIEVDNTEYFYRQMYDPDWGATARDE